MPTTPDVVSLFRSALRSAGPLACCVAVTGLATTGLANHARAATPWPEFRGATGDGVSPDHNVPVEWSESQGVAWKTPIPGKAWASPVIWDRLVWLANATEDGTRLSAVAVACDSDGREQLVIPSAGATIAYDPTSGAELWRVRHGGMNASARPLFANGLVYINTAAGGMKFLAVRPDGTGDVTGSHIAWKSSQGTGSRSSQLLLGERLFLIGDAGTASVLDAATGKAVWQKRLGGEFSASPILADGRIDASNQSGDTFVLSAAIPSTVIATNTLDEGCMASPAVFDGALYLRTKTHLYRLGGQP